MKQLRQLQEWLEQRTGLLSAWQKAASRAVPGGASLWHAFPSVLLFLFAQEVVLGVVMAMYYSPSSAGAWASVAYLNDQVTLGWFLRGLHHHTSYAMVIVGALYVVYLVIVGGYRRPREVYWLSAVALAGLCIAMALSGSLLPWDEQAVGRIAVETSIMASVPGGEPQRMLLVGGKEFGNFTLLRLYSFHVFVLPLLFAGLLLLHRRQVVRHGEVSSPLSASEAQRQAVRFFPHQLLLDVLAMMLVGVVLLLATVKTQGTELFGPLVSGSKFQARPEWYFLFLNQLLHYFEGPAQIIGTVILPGAAGELYFSFALG